VISDACAIRLLQQPTNPQVGALVKAGAFDRPKALVLLNLAGVAPDGATLDAIASALPDGTTARARVVTNGGDNEPASPARAEELVGAQARVAAANPGVTFEALDESALKVGGGAVVLPCACCN
jgi:hypothetical protein